jgi:hypothetical protein
MTIRDFIKGRYKRMARWAAPIGGALLLPMFFLPPNLLIDKVLLAALVALGAAICGYMVAVRCPVCAKRFGLVGLYVGTGRSIAPDMCPNCKISFDAPMPRDA